MNIQNLFFFNTTKEEQAYRQIKPLVDSLSRYEYKVYYNTDWDEEKKNSIANVSEYMSLDKYIREYNEMKTLFICFNIYDVLKLRKKIKNNQNFKIMFRPRGILPEESFLRNNSMIRKLILNIIEKKAIKESDFLCFISNNQRTHFFSKYSSLVKRKKTIVIRNYLDYEENCISEHLRSEKTIRIVYSGGFSKWQKIEKIFEVIKKLQDRDLNIEFYIYTFKENYRIAKKYIEDFKLESKVFVEYHAPDRLKDELKKNDIGILFRDDDIVNMSASPFKIIDYLSSGLGVIATDNIGDYSDILKGKEYAYLLNSIDNALDESEIDKMVAFIKRYSLNKHHLKEKIKNDYRNIFDLKNEIEKLHQFICNI